MKAVPVYFSLGTNQGDRAAQIDEALRRMDAAIGRPYAALSSIIETPSWGFEGPDFLNLCVLYRPLCKGTPEEHATEILRQAKEIEKALGRTEEALFDADGKRVYHNRIIDIDILLYGTQVIKTDELIIPHPLIGQRDFVKKPLLEISKPAVREAFPEIFE